MTGGIGTEYLTDFTQKISISFPTSNRLRWNVDAAYDYYSSASTDNIDNIRSSDSSSDLRAQLNVGLQYVLSDNRDLGFHLGTSNEYDYTSVHAGMNYSIRSQDGNTNLDIRGQAFYDIWTFFFPKELRRKVSLPTDKRQSYNVAASLTQVINKKMQVSLMSEATYMTGLLSTPFHRVYFVEKQTPDIERLPEKRLKVPLGLRLNAYLSERLILRTYYRYYWDSWGMKAHTASVELPIKINRFFALCPHYRYHTQSAVDYFNPYKESSISDQYYTSDFDLASLNSHSYGLGIIYGKSDGLARWKIPIVNKKLLVETVDIKYSRYHRSTGLNAEIISLGIKFSI